MIGRFYCKVWKMNIKLFSFLNWKLKSWVIPLLILQQNGVAAFDLMHPRNITLFCVFPIFRPMMTLRWTSWICVTWVISVVCLGLEKMNREPAQKNQVGVIHTGGLFSRVGHWPKICVIGIYNSDDDLQVLALLNRPWNSKHIQLLAIL